MFAKSEIRHRLLYIHIIAEGTVESSLVLSSYPAIFRSLTVISYHSMLQGVSAPKDI